MKSELYRIFEFACQGLDPLKSSVSQIHSDQNLMAIIEHWLQYFVIYNDWSCLQKEQSHNMMRAGELWVPTYSKPCCLSALTSQMAVMKQQALQWSERMILPKLLFCCFRNIETEALSRRDNEYMLERRILVAQMRSIIFQAHSPGGNYCKLQWTGERKAWRSHATTTIAQRIGHISLVLFQCANVHTNWMRAEKSGELNKNSYGAI